MTQAQRYLDMERAFYADLTARSRYDSEGFASEDTAELVVGSYAQHERFDYEHWLFGGVAPRPGAVALEYGCGPGRMLLRMAPHFTRVDGADISQEVLAVAQQRCATLATPPRLFVTDGQSLPGHLRGVYDAAFSVICLQHICVRSVRQSILDALYHCLKPGGLLTFQMGYGPGHQAMIDYEAEYLDATGTNGEADVTVLHPAEIAVDLARAGFRTAGYSLTPTGPGDTHGAWIFVRALKPGDPTALIDTSDADWSAVGFQRMVADVEAITDARRRHREHGALARYRDLAADLARERERHDQARVLHEAEADAARLAYQQSWALAQAEREMWCTRLAAVTSECAALRRRIDLDEHQLVRLGVADSRRVARLINDLVTWAAEGCHLIGVLGSGRHTERLLRETSLGQAPALAFFDNDPAAVGRVVHGVTVRPGTDLAVVRPDAVVLSSLAFQDDMAAFADSLRIPEMRVVRCYP